MCILSLGFFSHNWKGSNAIFKLVRVDAFFTAFIYRYTHFGCLYLYRLQYLCDMKQQNMGSLHLVDFLTSDWFVPTLRPKSKWRKMERGLKRNFFMEHRFPWKISGQSKRISQYLQNKEVLKTQTSGCNKC